MAANASIPTISHSFPPKSFNNPRINCFLKHPSHRKPHLSFTLCNPNRLKISVKSQKETEDPTVTVASVEQEGDEAHNLNEQIGDENDEQQEMDWKSDEEFKKFMGNPSIEAAIKLEKKRTDRKLKELDRETGSDNPIVGLFNRLVRDNLSREKQRLELAEQSFKALDLNTLKSCFGFTTFFATDVRRFGDGGIFIGNLRRPIEEVIPTLEKKLSEAAGREVVLWFMEEKNNDITKQVCVVQPKSEIDLQFELTKLSTPWGYVSAVALAVTTFGTIALMSGFFLKPDATFNDYLADVVPLFSGFLTILGVSEIATRVTAARYGVKLSPSFLVPSNWTGCLGVMNNYESLLPNKKALFDIAVARTASAYLTSLALAVTAFIADGSFNGGDNALYIRPQFFYNNPLLSFIQFVIGPYTDDLGNVLPYAVEGVGVPVDPLAFAGLLGEFLCSVSIADTDMFMSGLANPEHDLFTVSNNYLGEQSDKFFCLMPYWYIFKQSKISYETGMVVTSLNLLPCGRLEGGRIAQAMLGRSTATLLSFATSLLLVIGGFSGSILCLAWGLFATFFRGGEEIPAKDEITPLGDDRVSSSFVSYDSFLRHQDSMAVRLRRCDDGINVLVYETLIESKQQWWRWFMSGGGGDLIVVEFDVDGA
ncbi:hypothetical protein E3N88_09008 [Mikania micrantha]|uniref:Zinc metallopeptidase EGY3, chloroplastic n=1 Tax=Mikania micrantha TaxID=192012 RepID=A0A5N6PIG7_9ASTR|nr:hypothetical protein E3N88_09008 [Mikania micrantha]